MRQSSGGWGHSFDRWNRGRHRTLAWMASGDNLSDPPFGAQQLSIHWASHRLSLSRGRSLARAHRRLVESHPHIAVAPRIYDADARADIHVKGWIPPPGVECFASRTSTISNRSPSGE